MNFFSTGEIWNQFRPMGSSSRAVWRRWNNNVQTWSNISLQSAANMQCTMVHVYDTLHPSWPKRRYCQEEIRKYVGTHVTIFSTRTLKCPIFLMIVMFCATESILTFCRPTWTSVQLTNGSSSLDGTPAHSEILMHARKTAKQAIRLICHEGCTRLL